MATEVRRVARLFSAIARNHLGRSVVRKAAALLKRLLVFCRVTAGRVRSCVHTSKAITGNKRGLLGRSLKRSDVSHTGRPTVSPHGRRPVVFGRGRSGPFYMR